MKDCGAVRHCFFMLLWVLKVFLFLFTAQTPGGSRGTWLKGCNSVRHFYFLMPLWVFFVLEGGGRG